MGVVIGYDVGMSAKNPSAYAIIEFNPQATLIKTGVIEPFNPKDYWENKVRDIASEVKTAERYFDGKYPLVVAVEIPFFGGEGENAHTTIALSAIVGGIFANSVARTAVAVTPAQAKKALAKNGQATKADMVAAAKAKWGVDMTDHEAAACGVALAGTLLQIGRSHKNGMSVKSLSEVFGIDQVTIRMAIKNMSKKDES